MSALRLPPGPGRLRLAGWLPKLGSDALGAFEALHAEYGDVVFLPLPATPVCLVRDPEAIGAILMDGSGDLVKLRELRRRHYAMLFGRGLFVSDGENRRKHRLAATKALRKRSSAAHGTLAAELAGRMAAGWRDGETRDLHEDLMQLTLDIALRSMAGIAAGASLAAIATDLRYATEYFSAQKSMLRMLEMIVPGFVNPGFRGAVARLDAVLADAIAARRAAPGDDVLSHLLAGEEPLDDTELRDAVMNLVLGAHEPGALALTWACALLAQHPEVQEALANEIRTVADGGAPAAADLDRLPLLARVLAETLRLYPPIPGVGREVLRDYDIGPYRVPKATQIVMNQWVTHRDSRWFSQPEAFLPSRWEEGAGGDVPRHAYFPFGAGQRLCVGKNVAEMQAMRVLATLVSRWRFAVAPDAALERTPSMMLRPRRAHLVVSARP